MGKHLKIHVIAALAVAAIFACLTLGTAREVRATDQPEGFPMVIELEDFEFQNGKIVEHKDASGGKAVVATNLQFSATKTVRFNQPGYYELTFIMNAPDGASDAINVKTDVGPFRIYPDEKLAGTFTECLKKVPITVKNAGDEITILVFTSNEMGAMYDKIIINYIQPL